MVSRLAPPVVFGCSVLISMVILTLQHHRQDLFAGVPRPLIRFASRHARARPVGTYPPRRPGDVNASRIIWIHLHNFAGTTMCRLAELQQELHSEKRKNCNLDGDMCSQTDANKRIHCAARVHMSDISFSSIERMVLDDDVNCEDALYGIVLRDPLSAVRSTTVGNLFNISERQRILTALRSGVRPEIFPNERRFNHHWCLPPWDTYQHVDNFAENALRRLRRAPRRCHCSDAGGGEECS